MKFIKLFESFNKKGIKETCEDILLELQDLGFESDVHIDDIVDTNNKTLPDSIAVSIGYNQLAFDYDDIKEVTNRLIEYLESDGYTLQYPIRVAAKSITYPVSDIQKLDGKEIWGICFIFDRNESITENSKNDPIPELNKKDKLGIILLGAPGMGKSTFVKTFIRNQTIKTFSTDDVSLMFTKDPNVYHGGSSEINLNRLKGFMKTGQSFIYDTTGTQEENVRDIHNLAKFNGYTTIFIHVIGPLDTAIRQNQERDRQVPEDYIRHAYERQFGNMSKYSNELHPNAYYIVQNINGKYKFSKYESGKVLKRKASLYESVKEELDGEMIHYIFDDIIDDFGGDNVIFYDFFNKVTYGNDSNKLKNLAISNDIYNSRGFRFKVTVDMKGSEYDKFVNLVNMFNSCLNRLNDLGWNLFSMNVDCDSNYSNNNFRRVTFILSKPEEEIKDRSFDTKEMTNIIQDAFEDKGLNISDIDFTENREKDNECTIEFSSMGYDGKVPRNIEDILSDIGRLIGASDTNVIRDNEVIYTWNEWDPSHYQA